jgi:hypothetical protein
MYLYREPNAQSILIEESYLGLLKQMGIFILYLLFKFP